MEQRQPMRICSNGLLARGFTVDGLDLPFPHLTSGLVVPAVAVAEAAAAATGDADACSNSISKRLPSTFLIDLNR